MFRERGVKAGRARVFHLHEMLWCTQNVARKLSFLEKTPLDVHGTTLLSYPGFSESGVLHLCCFVQAKSRLLFESDVFV